MRLAVPALVLLLALGLGACATTTTYYGAPAAELHGKRILLLRPSLIPPTSESLQAHVVSRIAAGMAKLPDLGPIVGPGQVPALTTSQLTVRNAYNQYSNTVSLTGISDPALARELATGLKVDLLAIAQPTYIPCDPLTCKGGSELWLVGAVFHAHTGKLAFRTHISVSAPSDKPKALQELADSLTRDYLQQLELAFRRHAHRERFTHLKALAKRGRATG